MKKMFKWLGRSLLSLFKRLGRFIYTRKYGFASLVFIWAVPIYMLNETVALTQVNVAFKIKFMGCLTLFAIFLAFRKKIYAKIHELKHGIGRGILLSLHKATSYGLLLGILWDISTFATKLYNWWLLSGISIGIGLVFIIADEYCVAKEKKKKEEDKASGKKES